MIAIKLCVDFNVFQATFGREQAEEVAIEQIDVYVIGKLPSLLAFIAAWH